MACYKCPHYVRHGRMDSQQTKIVFEDVCGLKIKRSSTVDQTLKRPKGKVKSRNVKQYMMPSEQEPPKYQEVSCPHLPFKTDFDYLNCTVYRDTFESAGVRNSVVPTIDFEYSENLTGASVTDMDLL